MNLRTGPILPAQGSKASHPQKEVAIYIDRCYAETNLSLSSTYQLGDRWWLQLTTEFAVITNLFTDL